jgi:hypothetical protein
VIRLTWPAWVFVICVVASLTCTVVGATIAAIAFARLAKHLDRTSSEAATLVDAQRVERNLARINNFANGIQPLIERSFAALGSLNAALTEMRLPEAMLALRTARAAVRLLISGR